MINKNMAVIIVIIAIGVLIGAFGQILIKQGVSQIGEVTVNFKNFFPVLAKIITNKFVFCGLALSAIAAFLWIMALSRASLSFVYPLGVALLCITIIILSKIILKENITINQIIGTTTILLGIVILSK